MSGMEDLIAFLRARLDEDEQAARAAAEAAQTGVWIDGAEGSVLGVGGDMHLRGAVLSIDDIGPHIARWDPARVLAEVEAKRRILALFDDAVRRQDENTELMPHQARWSDPEWSARETNRRMMGQQLEGEVRALGAAVRAIGLPYAGHPDYRPEWRS